MASDSSAPIRPVPPPSRAERSGLRFNSIEECNAYFAQPLWRRVLGLTDYDRRLRDDMASLRRLGGYQPRRTIHDGPIKPPPRNP